MTAVQVLDVARAAGVRIEPHGDKLRLRAPEKPSDELLELLRQHKPAIIQYLHRGIGVARPPEPHRRCPCCEHGLHRDDVDRVPCFSCRVPSPWWRDLDKARVM